MYNSVKYRNSAIYRDGIKTDYVMYFDRELFILTE